MKLQLLDMCRYIIVVVVICLSQAKIPCSRLCRCVGCKNFEESPDRQNLLHLANAAEVRVKQQAAAETKLAGQLVGPPVRPAPPISGAERFETSHFSFLFLCRTSDYACASILCLFFRFYIGWSEIAGVVENWIPFSRATFFLSSSLPCLAGSN